MTVAAFAVFLLATSTPSIAQRSGRFQIRPITPAAACLTNDEGFGARLPFVRHVRCPAVPPASGSAALFWWDLAAQRDGRFQIKHTATNRCATVARNVVLGLPAIDLRPCETPIPNDQLFRLIRAGGGSFEFHTASGLCWYWRFEAYNSENVERRCGASSAFRLINAR
jgi:hypothetical protein